MCVKFFGAQTHTHTQFLPRDAMLSAIYATTIPSVHLSVCPSHWWISQKRLKLRSCNFHRTVRPHPSSFCVLSFIWKFWWVPPQRGHQTKVRWEKFAVFSQQLAISQKQCKIRPKLLLMTNMKSHMPFRLVPKTTLDDLERPIRILFLNRCVFRSPPQKNWVKIDPYYQRQKCRPLTLVSGDIKFVRIFAGVLWRGVSNAISSSFLGILYDFADLRGNNVKTNEDRAVLSVTEL